LEPPAQPRAGLDLSEGREPVAADVLDADQLAAGEGRRGGGSRGACAPAGRRPARSRGVAGGPSTHGGVAGPLAPSGHPSSCTAGAPSVTTIVAGRPMRSSSSRSSPVADTVTTSPLRSPATIVSSRWSASSLAVASMTSASYEPSGRTASGTGRLAPAVVVGVRSVAGTPGAGRVLHLGEEHDVAQRRRVGDQGHETVDAQAQARHRGHAVLHGLDEVLLHHHRLVVAGRPQRHLLLQA